MNSKALTIVYSSSESENAELEENEMELKPERDHSSLPPPFFLLLFQNLVRSRFILLKSSILVISIQL